MTNTRAYLLAVSLLFFGACGVTASEGESEEEDVEEIMAGVDINPVRPPEGGGGGGTSPTTPGPRPTVPPTPPLRAEAPEESAEAMSESDERAEPRL